MIYLKTKEITLQPDQVDIIKNSNDAYFNLYISNKTDEKIEILFDETYEEVNSGIIITNKTLSFDNDVPKNKIRVKNLGNEEVKITVLWSE